MLATAAAGFLLDATVLAQAAGPPPPGRLVEVDAHKVHLHCTGAGAPTVVIEARTKRALSQR